MLGMAIALLCIRCCTRPRRTAGSSNRRSSNRSTLSTGRDRGGRTGPMGRGVRMGRGTRRAGARAPHGMHARAGVRLHRPAAAGARGRLRLLGDRAALGVEPRAAAGVADQPREAGAPGVHPLLMPRAPMRVIHCAGRQALTSEEEAAVGVAVRAGGVLLFPTDTLYGLGVDPRSAAGLAALFRLKGRDPGKPLPVLLADASLVERYAASIPAPWPALMRRFWPGRWPLLFPARPDLPPGISCAAGKVALRVPGSALCRTALEAARAPHRDERKPVGSPRDGRPRGRLARARRRGRPVPRRGDAAPVPGVHAAGRRLVGPGDDGARGGDPGGGPPARARGIPGGVGAAGGARLRGTTG